jgi:sugar-specific transcriptional regulator TrmB
VEKKEILDVLRKFDLGDYEARTYVTLALLGSSKAGYISKESGVPQSKIYDVLEELITKQLVEVSEGRPKEFRAVSPSVALKGMIERRENELKSLKSKVSLIDSLLKPVRGEVIEGVWIQKGRKQQEVMNRLADMLSRCNEYVYDITRDFSYSPEYRKAIKSCIRRGVKLRIMGMKTIDESNYFRAKWYDDNKIPIKIFETTVHPRILVVDGKELAIRLDNNPLKKSFSFQSIWSEDPSLVKVMDSYMKNLWSMAKPVNMKTIHISSL